MTYSLVLRNILFEMTGKYCIFFFPLSSFMLSLKGKNINLRINEILDKWRHLHSFILLGNHVYYCTTGLTTVQLLIISLSHVVAQYLPPSLVPQLNQSLNSRMSQQRILTPTLPIRIIFITATDSSLISPEIPSGGNIKLQCYFNKANTP